MSVAKKKKRVKRATFPIVGLGASAGGMEAVVEVLKSLPPHPGLAFVVVQHLDPSRESLLSSLLAKATSMPVREAREGDRVEVDRVYVIPPGKVLSIENRTLRASKREDESGRLRVIDHFFTSLARDAKEAAIGVVLSGTGSDGVAGLEAIKAEGGITMAQDEESAKYPEMPRSAIEAGCADLALSPAALARELVRVGRHPYVADGAPGSSTLDETPTLTRLFGILRKQTQADFSGYKRPTLGRRIARRMALHRIVKLDDYAAFVEDNSKEAEALYNDMLIKVTGFFRDPGAFAFLKSKVLPALLKSRSRNAPLRIWTPGCATGEEAYSIAICAVEFLSAQGKPVPCQVFATDLSEAAVERARTGFYPDRIAQDVPPERLRRFFAKVEGGYQISKMIRDMCVIARQDLLKDPPFSKLDLISCRNVLIYLEPSVHRKLFPLFHYSLRPGGYLMLGTSETVGSFTNLFGLVDRKYKIYQRRPATVPVQFDVLPPMPVPSGPESAPEKAHPPVREADVQKEIDRLLLARYTPPGVVVNGSSDILQFRGHTDRYLQPAPGKASLNLLKMVREGMLFEVRSCLQKARREGTPQRSKPVQVPHDGRILQVSVEVLPLRSAEPRGGQFLVLFHDIPLPARSGARTREKVAGKKALELEGLLEQMRLELAGTKEHLQSIIEEQETTNEELRSANEEILSSNEELQSTNEELETAKEELQSTNEELTTLNEELQIRNAELLQVNNDITNLLGSVNIPIVMLGNDLRIRRFTPPAEKILNVIAGDVGRPITDIQTGFDVPDLGKLILDTLESGATVDREVRDGDGHRYSLRIRPYMTRDKKIEGAVLVLLDLDSAGKRNSQ